MIPVPDEVITYTNSEGEEVAEVEEVSFQTTTAKDEGEEEKCQRWRVAGAEASVSSGDLEAYVAELNEEVTVMDVLKHHLLGALARLPLLKAVKELFE
jgi:hypothetical protein